MSMNIAVDCPDCCTCPTPILQWDSVSWNNSYSTQCGFFLNADGCGPNWYITRAHTYTPITPPATPPCDCDPYNELTCVGDSVVTCDCLTISNPGPSDQFSTITSNWDTCIATATTQSLAAGAYKRTLTYSDPVPWALVESKSFNNRPAFDNDWNDTAGSMLSIASNGLVSTRDGRYRFKFKKPEVGYGSVYNLRWTERFVAESGSGLLSVEIISPGVYRPNVTFSNPPAGGVRALGTAVMSASGSVQEVRILNPGKGYTTTPSITFSPFFSGAPWSYTASIASASLYSGSVDAVTVISGGYYMPRVTISSADVIIFPTFSSSMDSRGGLSAIYVVNTGSLVGPASVMAITHAFTSANPLVLPAVAHEHYGIETIKSGSWDGILPSGYNAATQSTYPQLPNGTSSYYSPAFPNIEGTTIVVNVKGSCYN